MLTVGCDGGVDPTGDANAGDGKKCGNEAACIAVNAAVGCGVEKGGCKGHKKIINKTRSKLQIYSSVEKYTKCFEKLRDHQIFLQFFFSGVL